MLTSELHEYLVFISKYFSVDSDTIIQKSLDLGIISSDDSPDTIISRLKESIGYQRRLLEPLAVALTKSTPFDTLVSLVTIRSFENHLSLLIADQYNIFRLLYFFKDQQAPKFPPNSVLKLDSCYYKEQKLFTNSPPRPIWFYDFPSVFTIRDYYINNLPECIYDEDYTKITNLVHIIGYFFTQTRNDKLFCFIHSKELQIRLIPFKIEDLDSSFSTHFVKLTFCELAYGPDAYQLKMTEFSEITELTPIPLVLAPDQFKRLVRFEYPSMRMSLSELTDKTVAATKIKILNFDYSDDTWKFYGYDSSQAVCLTVFDQAFAEQLTSAMTDESFFLIDGIYKRGKRYYLRERPENVQIISYEEEDEIEIPVSRPDQLDEEKLVILDIIVTEITERTFVSKENKHEKYEKLRCISYNTPISINNYNMKYYQKFLVGESYRVFFVKSKFYNGNLYFIMDSNSIFTKFG